MEIDYKAIGKRVKIARIRTDYTQESLAGIVGLSPSHMSNVETGSTKVSLPTLINIANALSVSIDELLCDNVFQTKICFEKEIAELLSDCDNYEIRILTGTIRAVKDSLRKERRLLVCTE